MANSIPQIRVAGNVANAKLYEGFEYLGPRGMPRVTVGKYYNSDDQINKTLDAHGFPPSNGIEEPVLIVDDGFITPSDAMYGGRSVDNWDAHLRFYDRDLWRDHAPGLLVHTVDDKRVLLVLDDVLHIDVGTFTAAGPAGRFDGLPASLRDLTDPWA